LFTLAAGTASHGKNKATKKERHDTPLHKKKRTEERRRRVELRGEK